MASMFRIVAALVMLGTAVLPASAQDYPFFVQPMTVQDVRVIADELDLARDQRLAVLSRYEAYNLAFEELQEKDVKAVMDHLMDVVTRVQWWGGEIEIPSRKEVMDLVRKSLRAIHAFGRIDDEFFEGIVPLLGESQLIRLEQEKQRRALARLSLLHRNMVGEINEGASPDLFGIMRRIEVEVEVELLVDEILADHAKKTLAALNRFESAGVDAIEKVLDEIDRLGLRDMDMASMMQFFGDEARQEELKSLFDVLSKPLQEKAAVVSRENRRAWSKLMEVLPPEQAADLRVRFVQSGYREVDRGVRDIRGRLAKLKTRLGDTPEAGDVNAAIETLDEKWASLVPTYVAAIDTRNTYRTMAQLEGETPTDADSRIEQLDARRASLVDAAEAVLAAHGEEEDSTKASKFGDSLSGGGGGGGTTAVSKEDAAAKLRAAPLTAEQVENFGRWLGADDDTIDLMRVMHGDYETKSESMLQKRAGDAIERDGERDEEQTWYDRRARWRDIRADAAIALDALESELFTDLALALPAEIDRERVERVRAAMERSRRRARVAGRDWRSQSPEANIDLTAVVLALDPSQLTEAERGVVLDGLVGYEAEVEPLIEDSAERISAIQKLEQKLWSDGAKDYDPEIRAAMRSRLEKRREALSKISGDLAAINRDVSEYVISSVSDHAGLILRDAYERSAYPDIFDDESSVDPVVEEVLQVELGPDQRQKVETHAGEYRQAWLELTRRMVDTRRSRPPGRMFPPTRERMETELMMERLKYRRRQLDERALVQLELLLEPWQVAQVPALSGAESGSDGNEAQDRS